MKLSDAIMIKPLVEKLVSKEMSAKAAMEFAMFAKEILIAVQEFEIKRAGLFEKYGEKVDEKNWKIKEENEAKFKSAINRAMNKELDIDSFDMSNSGIDVTPADVINVLSSLK
jgi:hypothetical protein